MTEKHILAAMTYIDSAYIDSAQKKLGYLPTEKKKKRRPIRFNIAAAIAVILMCALFFQTPIGARAAEIVQEQVAKLIEILFPPKDILVTPEGITDMVPHEAHGKEPSVTQPGFVIYIDEERYAITEEESAWFIRPIVYDAAWPKSEIEIREIPDKDYETAAEEVRKSLLDSWETVSGIYRPLEPPCMIFNANNGTAWESACEDHYFYENGNEGTYHIISRYFVGVAEGHGTRFAAMVNTFTLIAPQDASRYETPEDAVQGAMAQEAAYAQALVDELVEKLQTDSTMTQSDMNINAQRRYELWDEVLNKVWDCLERSMDKNDFKALKKEQLEWIDNKEAKMDNAVAEVQGGSLAATVYYGAGAQITERRVYELLEYLTGERTVENIVWETAPEELIPGQSTIDDVSLYYQEKFPDKNIYSTLRDLDGDHYGDLAVYYDGTYRALYLMDESYVLKKEILFEEGFRFYEYSPKDGDGSQIEPNIIGTDEATETGDIKTYYEVNNGVLVLREAIRFDSWADTGENKWYAIGDGDWVTISKDTYGKILFSYTVQADNLKPIEDYFLR